MARKELNMARRTQPKNEKPKPRTEPIYLNIGKPETKAERDARISAAVRDRLNKFFGWG